MLMLFTFLAGLYLLRETRQGPLENVNHYFVDWLEGNTALTVPKSPVALIEIDDASLAESSSAGGEKHGWPWQPLDYALYLQAATTFQAPVVAIEPVLAWETLSNESKERREEHAQYAQLLHNALLKVPKCLLGAKLGYTDDPSEPQAQQQVPTIRRVKGSRYRIHEYTAVDRLPDEEFRLSPTLGFINLPETEVTRKAPMVFRYRGEVVPSFVLQAMMLWFQLTPDDIQVVLGSHIALGPRVRIPIDEEGAMRLDFRVPYTRASYGDLILAAQQADLAPSGKENAQFTRKLTILGRTDEGARTIPLSNARQGAPAEVFATAIAMIQAQQFVQNLPASADWGFILIMMGVGPLMLRWRRRAIVGFAFAAIAGYALLAVWVFAATALALPLLLPVGLFLFSAAFAFFTR